MLTIYFIEEENIIGCGYCKWRVLDKATSYYIYTRSLVFTGHLNWVYRRGWMDYISLENHNSLYISLIVLEQILSYYLLLY
jgi:hypothetical protein